MSITFRRPISSVIQAIFDNAAALGSNTYNTELAAEVVLQDGTQLNWATKAIIMDSISTAGSSLSITPVTFVARLSGAPDIRHTQGKAPDSASMDVINLDYIVTSAMPTSARPYNNAYVTLYLAFPKPGGNYEGVPYFYGLLRDLQGDDETATFGPVSDLSNKAAVMGREITQRCLNVLGDTWCGVNNLPGGAVCTNFWHDTAAGCLYWGGNFKGAPFINPNGLVNGSTSGVTGGDGGGGWDSHCPDVETSWFPSADGGHIHASDLKVGDRIYTLDKEIVTVERARIIFSEYRYQTFTRVGAGLTHSASHSFLTRPNDDKGRAASKINPDLHNLVISDLRNTSLSMHGNSNMQRDAEYHLKPVAGGDVLELSVSAPNTYLVTNRKGIYLASHNKAIDPVFTGL